MTTNPKLNYSRRMEPIPTLQRSYVWLQRGLQILLVCVLGLFPMQSQGQQTASASPAALNQRCTELNAIHLPDTSITSAVVVPAGKLTFPKGVARAELTAAIPTLPAFCRVQGVLKPTSDSDIKFEVWMPISTWNGRFEQLGNGGYAGGIPYVLGMLPELKRGFAIAGTDDGHTGGPDQSWAIGHPEKIIDFAYRAPHVTSEAAKAVIKKFYKKAPSYSYFNGCSDGGREALMEAQRYPDDFNGILAGSPAIDWTHLMAGLLWDENLLLTNRASYIPVNKLPAIQAASLAACDAMDGVKDGILEDPSRCHFDPAVLECKGADGPDCLTAPQVTTLRKLYQGPRDPLTGKQIFPGHTPGNEAIPANWQVWIIGHWPTGGWGASFGNSFYSDMVFQNPKWDFRTFNLDKDVKISDAKFASMLNAYDPDLRKFKAHGGKMIHYHGWDDSGIAGQDSVNYYRSVVSKMGGLDKTQDFYRLYMAPGMAHCNGGPGPNSFGGIIQVRPEHSDASNNVADALMEWVEHGVAPNEIIATKYKDDDPKKPVLMTRPLCPYPQHARYKGTGSTNEAANFVCESSGNEYR